jgi:anthranilate phosphoribosyltransferase
MSSTHSKRNDSINSFTDIVRVIGRGATLGRTLTQAEAKQAAQWLLDGQVSDVQLGAFLMMLRLRTESPEEAAGLAEGLRLGMNTPAHLKADIDWPVYAGKRRQLPWFLLASLELAKQGKRVVMHGAVGGDSDRLYLEPVIRAMGLPIADNWQEAEVALNEHNWVYLRMESFFPQLVGWLDLKQALGLRSVMHTVARMLNPLNAHLSIRGVFHQEYVNLHAQVAQLQGQGRVLVIRGDGGEAEVSADKRIPMVDIDGGVINEVCTSIVEGIARPIAEDLSGDAVAQRLLAVLKGHAVGEDYGRATVEHTLASIDFTWAAD